MFIKRSLPFCGLLTAVLVLLSSGCASLRVNRFETTQPVAPKLPVKLEINGLSFVRNTGAYKLETQFVSEHRELMESWAKMHPGAVVDTTTLVRSAVEIPHLDPRENPEMIAYVRSQLERNVIDSGNPGSGYAVCQLVYRQSKRGFLTWFYFFSSMATMYLPNFLGYPLASMTTELELELVIQDSSRNIVGTYTSHGKGTGYAAMYWGYSIVNAAVPYSYGSAPRASYLSALRQATSGLLQQVQRDAAMIRRRLAG